MTDDNKASGDDQRALIKFLLENRSTVNYLSILMIIYAVWATIEVLTNAAGATWWPPETGIPASELFNNPSSSQNINNGWVIGLGAIFGTVGIMVQYFYRAAPYVDASMQATAALIISAAFLTCYLIYHYSYPTTKFTHEGWPKIIYFIILFTHIPLAMLSLPMIILTVIPAIRRKFEKHKRFAKWTYPVWLYVSVTGVLVYLMLYVWFPHDPLWRLRE